MRLGVRRPAILPPGKTRYPFVLEDGWAPGQVWTGAENLAPTGIRSPYRPARIAVAIPIELSRPTTLTVYWLETNDWRCGCDDVRVRGQEPARNLASISWRDVYVVYEMGNFR